MRTTTALAVISLSTAALAFPAGHIFERSLTTDAASVADKEFDFVIVGGGLAGLVVASRLSEWSNTTVLVIEAGKDGSEVALRREVPGFAYMRGLAFGSDYDWNFTTTADQAGLTEAKAFPVARGLGGGAAVNGMFWTRPGSEEFDAWAQLNNASSWNWADVDGYIKKAETVIPPSGEQQTQFNIQNDPTAHGSTGPLKVGWPSFIYSITEKWVPTWQGMGIPARDLAGGINRGAAIVPSCLDSTTGKRSQPSVSYVDAERTNLVVLSGQHVTKIDFNGTLNGDLVASGVEFQSGPDGTTYKVKANKEVIVSGGTVGSPKVLQLSGVGPKDVLSPLNVPVNLDLPVGYNFQDHVMVNIAVAGVAGAPETWGPLCQNATRQEEALAEWTATGTGPLTYVNAATAYTNLKDIGATVTVDTNALIQEHVAKYKLPENVQKGLAAQYDIMSQWLAGDVPQLETIMNLWGPTAEGAKFEAAVQHPWSRGTVFISSGNPYDKPKIDPNYLGTTPDIDIIVAGVEQVRKTITSRPLVDSLSGEVGDHANKTGAELVEWIRKASGSEYHPIGTCPMLPRDLGGVVDTQLKVYGTHNLRVIDASIIPIQVSAHTMAPAYGIAEKGADLIKAFYSSPPPTDKNSTASIAPLPSASGGTVPKDAKPSSASRLSFGWAALAALVALPAFL